MQQVVYVSMDTSGSKGRQGGGVLLSSLCAPEDTCVADTVEHRSLTFPGKVSKWRPSSCSSACSSAAMLCQAACLSTPPSSYSAACKECSHN